MNSNYRYPGVKPFSQADSHLFFGRTQDIQQLVRYLRTEELVVMHGKSGLGKTSLIQAGVIPQLEQSSRKVLPFTPLTFRFNSYNPRDPKNLPHIVEANISREPSFLDNLPVKYISLWQALKSRQLQEGAPAKPQGYLLIFDQFEELFTYPDDEVDAIGHDLADLYNRVMPAEVKKVLRREEMVNPELKAQLDKPGMREWLEAPVQIKMLMAIRSDKFNLMDRLSPYIPDILLNSRILEALNREQADEAIEMPAAMAGAFESPTFRYSAQARDKILDFLTSHNTRRVEGFQLQILCRNIEENLISFVKSGGKKSDRRIKIIKTPADAGVEYEVTDIDADFGNILRHYYDEQINKLDGEEEILLARSFIEDELIADGRRVSMDRAAIKNAVSDELLYKLENTRIIRREPNSMGGFSYEISHDTLLDPVMQAREERVFKQSELRKQQEAQEAILERQRELEAEREAQERELAKARAEKAEVETQRALEAEKAERRNKYFILTLLVLVLIIGTVVTLSLIRESKQSDMLEAKNRELIAAQDTLKQQQEILLKQFDGNQSKLDSVLSVNASLPAEQQAALRRAANFQQIEQSLKDSLSGLEYKAILRYNELVIRLNVFPSGVYQVSEANRRFLERIAAILQKYPNYLIDIEVHTDDNGADGQNAINSITRALAVMEIMNPVLDPGGKSKADRDPGRLSVSGKGEAYPITPGNDNENRRVDIVVRGR
ncbi:MAG: OmpA family protein [Bacteroidia bacterium]|nr:OmpA family protein [Bacteroidia bacterium]